MHLLACCSWWKLVRLVGESRCPVVTLACGFRVRALVRESQRSEGGCRWISLLLHGPLLVWVRIAFWVLSARTRCAVVNSKLRFGGRLECIM